MWSTDSIVDEIYSLIYTKSVETVHTKTTMIRLDEF